MSLIRPRFVAFLVAALVAISLCVVHVAASGGASSTGSTRETALVVRADKVDASVAHITDGHRRQTGTADRLLKQRLILFAVVAALCAGLVLRRRSAIVVAQPGRLQSALWVPQSGRGPPLFSS